MIDTIISSSVLILIILAIRVVFKGKINPLVQYILWSLVAIRLMAFSLFSILPIKSTLSVINAVKRVGLTVHKAPGSVQALTGHGDPRVIDNTDFIIDNAQKGFVAGSTGINPAAAVDWQLILMAIWITGIVVLALWFIFINRRFNKAIVENRKLLKFVNADRSKEPAIGSKGNEDEKPIKQKLLPVYVVEGLGSPCLMWHKGKVSICVSPGVARDHEKLRFTIAHELCHYWHRDLIWALLRCVLLVFYWFNPLVWVAAIMSKRDCELACDFSVLRRSGKEERLAYGKTLLDLIKQSDKKGDVLQIATSMYGTKNGIKERITMIAANKKMKASVLLVLLMVVILAVGCTFTTAPNDIYEDEEIDNPNHMEKISTFLKEASLDTFSPYYEVLDFIISDYQEEVIEGKVEATFQYKVVVKNYDKDPDTVNYIKEAKESGNVNYQQMYDEYLQPRDMNFHFKVVIDEDDSITLYSNVSPVGIEWEETKMDDFILK